VKVYDQRNVGALASATFSELHDAMILDQYARTFSYARGRMICPPCNRIFSVLVPSLNHE